MTSTQHDTVNVAQAVYVRVGPITLKGELYIPDGAKGVVLFVHGSGSSRYSPRDRLIAAALHEQHFATFLFDLLTPEESVKDIHTCEFRFNVGLLTRRVAVATDALARDPALRGLPWAYVATGTGAAAALMAAADNPARATAIVSRDGRPDLADEALGRVTTPTLLLAGSEDRETLAFNKKAYALLQCEKELNVISAADDLVDELRVADELVTLTRTWLERHFHPEMVTSQSHEVAHRL